MSEILSMGGYGMYVWPSYAIVAAVLYGNVLLAKMRRKRIIKELEELSEES